MLMFLKHACFTFLFEVMLFRADSFITIQFYLNIRSKSKPNLNNSHLKALCIVR